MAGAGITGEAGGKEIGEVRSAGVKAEGSEARGGVGSKGEGGEGSEAGGRAPWGCEVDWKVATALVIT